MLLDTSISVYFQSFMEWVYHNQHLRTSCVKRMKHFLCSKGNFLDVRVVKLYASVCSVILHWIGSTVTSFCVQFVVPNPENCIPRSGHFLLWSVFYFTCTSCHQPFFHVFIAHSVIVIIFIWPVCRLITMQVHFYYHVCLSCYLIHRTTCCLSIFKSVTCNSIIVIIVYILPSIHSTFIDIHVFLSICEEIHVVILAAWLHTNHVKKNIFCAVQEMRHLSLDLSPPNMICRCNCLIFMYTKMCIEIKMLQISLSLNSRNRIFLYI
jgi:hypothetical protein